MENKYGQDKLEFRTIVLSHIQRILEISSHELRDQSETITRTTHSEVISREDTRKAYIQAIENLSIILIPYFDDDMKKIYKESIKIIESYVYQLEVLFEEEIKEAIEKMEIKAIPKDWFVNKKVSHAKKIFIGLNLLLQRNDYLKESVYGETTSDDVVEDEEGDNEN